MFHIFAIDSSPSPGTKILTMPNCYRVILRQINSTVMGKELVDLDLVGVFGLELLGFDLDLLIMDLVLDVSHIAFVILVF